VVNNYDQLLDEVLVISRIIKVEVGVISQSQRLRGYQPKLKAEADNP